MAEAETSIPIREELVREPVSEVGQMSQWQLMRLRFGRNRLAMTGLIGLAVMYLIVFLGPFLGPNDYMYQNTDYVFGKPSSITFTGPDGRLSLRPYTYEVATVLDEKSFKFVFVENREKKLPIKFFVRGDPYTLFGFIKSDVHLFDVDRPQRLYLLGADELGRDLFTRILMGGQISMTIGLVGVALGIIFGSIMGTASGYWGGLTDDVMQRVIEIIMSFPTVPLWAALAAALPPISARFTALHRYFLITVILSLVGWTGLARQLRAKVMAYRQADFVQAALAAGASDARIIFVHMLPNAASHIIVVAALAIPGMILGETALSFLGLGILPPLVSWGALLRSAQQVAVVVQHPWLMIPGIALIITVLFFSFLGDGLRDAVDPYSI
ncbi:MAG: ABC transporter permease [Anaerolineae bacterium]|nr:ABC transporter permease [Anaerolineae bacterium]